MGWLLLFIWEEILEETQYFIIPTQQTSHLTISPNYTLKLLDVKITCSPSAVFSSVFLDLTAIQWMYSESSLANVCGHFRECVVWHLLIVWCSAFQVNAGRGIFRECVLLLSLVNLCGLWQLMWMYGVAFLKILVTTK